MKKIRSVDERWHLRSANSASITSPSHVHWRGDVRVRACNIWLPQGYSMKRGGAYWQTKALQTSRLSPNSHLFPNRATTAKRRPQAAVLSTVRKVWWGRRDRERAPVNFLKESFADEETCRDWYHRTRGMVARTSKWPFLETNLFVVTNSTISFQAFFASWSTSSSFSRSLQHVHRWLLWDRVAVSGPLRTCWSTSMLALAAPGPAQLLRFLKSSDCACAKISPSVWGILGDARIDRTQPNNTVFFKSSDFLFLSFSGFGG